MLALAIAGSIRAQQEPMDLLRRVQATVADSLGRLPRYMCTQTIDRERYEPDVHDRVTPCDEGRTQRSTHLATSDRLRVDVATASSGEMYAWVGEKRFNDGDLLDMVHEGAISTGDFSSFLNAIFRSEAASFTYDGETTRDGRTLSEFGFTVPYDRSNYQWGDGQHRFITGYDGTFLVDPGIADLVQLVVRTSRLPSGTAACYASTTLDYTRVRLKAFDFLLPLHRACASFTPMAAKRRTAPSFRIAMSSLANRPSRSIRLRTSAPRRRPTARNRTPSTSRRDFRSRWL
jgi:hypothetical protein